MFYDRRLAEQGYMLRLLRLLRRPVAFSPKLNLSLNSFTPLPKFPLLNPASLLPLSRTWSSYRTCFRDIAFNRYCLESLGRSPSRLFQSQITFRYKLSSAMSTSEASTGSLFYESLLRNKKSYLEDVKKGRGDQWVVVMGNEAGGECHRPE